MMMMKMPYFFLRVDLGFGHVRVRFQGFKEIHIFIDKDNMHGVEYL